MPPVRRALPFVELRRVGRLVFLDSCACTTLDQLFFWHLCLMLCGCVLPPCHGKRFVAAPRACKFCAFAIAPVLSCRLRGVLLLRPAVVLITINAREASGSYLSAAGCLVVAGRVSVQVPQQAGGTVCWEPGVSGQFAFRAGLCAFGASRFARLFAAHPSAFRCAPIHTCFAARAPQVFRPSRSHACSATCVFMRPLFCMRGRKGS